MSSRSGRTNRNERGSSYDRRARRAWLVSERAGFGGDGVKVPCWECGKLLTEDQVIPDRLIPGELGGTYRRSNIKGPHCALCSCRQGARRTAELRAAADPYDEDGICRECGVEFWASLKAGHAPGCHTPEREETRPGW